MPKSYLRQHEFYDPEKQNPKVVVVGAGSLGSNIVFLLAKMGVSDIMVYDGDRVEEHNIPNQIYSSNHVGWFKTLALQTIIKTMSSGDTSLSVFDEMVTPVTNLPIETDIFILATDSLKSRRLVYSLIEFNPAHLIDPRAGGEGFQVYYCNLMDMSEKEEYVKTLEGEDNNKFKCGEETVIYNVMSCAAEVCSIVKRIVKNQAHPVVIKREMSVARILGR